MKENARSLQEIRFVRTKYINLCLLCAWIAWDLRSTQTQAINIHALPQTQAIYIHALPTNYYCSPTNITTSCWTFRCRWIAWVF